MGFVEFFKGYEFLGNSGYDYIVSAVIFVGLLIALKIFQVIILARLKQLAKKTKTEFDDVLIKIFTKVKPPFYLVVALFFAVKALTLPSYANTLVKAFFIIAVVYEIIQAIHRLVDYFAKKYIDQADEEDKGTAESMMSVVKIIVAAVVWIVGILVVLSNLGVNVTSLVASLGVGGLAVALALQKVFADLFSSLSIYIDKPFKVGDFIVIGEHKGTVERIGLKTTRIRSLTGEELVVSNTELTSTRVQNFKRMTRRRALFHFGIVYGTSQKKIESVPDIVKEIIDKTKNAEFDRCHFYKFGDSSLDFEVVYYVESSDYNAYMDIQQSVNLSLCEKFAKEKIVFAYPTQTIYLQK
ncbi:MAG: mechanosensitive ion channel protein MscS [Candidatus Buchananbacteria bacterium CG10_big_fil_rev_8_21_14_0_10_42_9]|uniref:Mechanosensitive ion channel protein MscS n=1 Tax=Candidatus Buchananbacteria bacterium CG10_big_fil_rev_8_21_14_0_10_42_9 TaxID=1974526 RepID=A0A2H0VZP2_9BACT|nr:MAG: mechanosensitive ion channel protein MscS [Candidatus Buchananbacteria bacterium CG10_big_fil_rev_8_21_14_0_10_42_9]